MKTHEKFHEFIYLAKNTKHFNKTLLMGSDQFEVHINTIRKHQSFEIRIGLDVCGRK